MVSLARLARADDDTVSASKLDPRRCEAQVAPAPPPPPPEPEGPGDKVDKPPEVNVLPSTWKEFELAGSFLEDRDTVRNLIAPIMERNRALTPQARDEIRRAIAAFGYHVVGIGLRDTAAGTIAIVHLAPLPMVRRVDITIKKGLFDTLLDDEVRRRMRARASSYLAWSPEDRFCELYHETERIQAYLRDQGYIDARARIQDRLDGVGVVLDVHVDLGPEYEVAPERLRITDASTLAIDADTIRGVFKHRGNCLVGRFICFGSPRFTREQFQKDKERLTAMFRDRGFPSVRITTSIDDAEKVDPTAFIRKTRKVQFTIEILQGRQVEVVFEGHNHNAVSDAALRKQLTFDRANSADDVEAHESARAIASYLQSRGYFDARVTWIRERLGDEVDPERGFDRLVYRIEMGRSRDITRVEFRGNKALSTGELAGTVGTRVAKLSTSIFGNNTAATSTLLSTDVERIVDLYRRKGYRDARVRVTAATDPAGLDSAALAAALVLANHGQGLYVRYTIDEGQPTLITQVVVELSSDKGDEIRSNEDLLLCLSMLGDLAELFKHPELSKQSTPDRCVAVANDLPFREDDAALTPEALRERLFDSGRPRADVQYEPAVVGPRRVAAKYRLSNTQELRVGEVVIRGNFRTRESVIRGELRLRRGAPLTKDIVAEAARRLRGTALFDAVNIATPELETTSAGEVNLVVEVTERHDNILTTDFEAGYSSYNGAFFRAVPAFRNLWGLGISLELSGTIGFDIGAAINREAKLRQLGAEATLRFPAWLSRSFSPIEFQTELSAFHDRRDTPRFGQLITTGTTIALSKTKDWPRTASHPARAATIGIHWDFRRRERNVDALRPIGADDDESQVPITTRTGLIGITGEWEQRVDRQGTLSPLAPEAGFRLDGQVALAHRYLLGQDDFLKVSAAGSKYRAIGDSLLLRADFRYDQGFPLGGVALLPEVERFFAGGDPTVRGYEDDRLATEVIQVGVPPFDNVQQIRVLPAGGNIRVLGGLDAQVRIYKLFASALFVDAGLITNQWSTIELDDIRPAVGMSLLRAVTPFGAFAIERAIPLNPKLGDDPRGRWHISFAARAQF